MDAYIPPPSPGASRPLSRGDYGQENANNAPLVPPSTFFSSTLPTSHSVPSSNIVPPSNSVPSSNYLPPSHSLTLFNQPPGLPSGPVVHFHTPLQNTVFPSVSQSLPPSPLPSNFVRDVPPHLELPDGAAPVCRCRRSIEHPRHTVPNVSDPPSSDVVSPITTPQPIVHHPPSHHHAAPMTPFTPQQTFSPNSLPPPTLPVPPAPPPLPNILGYQAFYQLPPPPTITVPPTPPPLPNIQGHHAFYQHPPHAAFYPPPYHPHVHAQPPPNVGFAYPPHPFPLLAPLLGCPRLFLLMLPKLHRLLFPILFLVLIIIYPLILLLFVVYPL